jgi:hypothetical protein
MNNKYYVSMTDNFLSGWGLAEGKINKYIVECNSYEQAKIIENNARKRSEMKYISICINKPCYNSQKYISTYRLFNELGDVWTNK